MSLAVLRAAVSVAALVPAVLIGAPLQLLVQRLGLRSVAIPLLFHRWGLLVVGVRVRVVGRPAEQRPLLMVANHASWLDINALGSITPLSFVAKAEIAAWPGFGTLARLQRSIFVDRNRRAATGDVSRLIAARMAEGDPVVLFAEGTSGDGNRVLPFRSALIGAARAALVAQGADAAHLQPVSIAYTHRNGLPLGLRSRPEVAWYGDLDFVPHLWSVLKNGAIDMTVQFGTPIRVDATTDRKLLARQAEREVRRMTADALRGRDADVVPAAEGSVAEDRVRRPDKAQPSGALS